MAVTFDQVKRRTICTPVYRLNIRSRNLVQNSSFEDLSGGESGWTPRWTQTQSVGSGNAEIVGDITAPHGARVLKITERDDCDVQVSNDDYECEVTAGDKYTFSCRYMMTADLYIAGVVIRWYQQDGTYISAANLWPVGLTNVQEWTSASEICTAPALAALALVRLTTVTATTAVDYVLFDAVQFERDPYQDTDAAPTPYLGSYLDLWFSSHPYLHDDPRLISPGGGKRTFLEEEGRYEHTLNLPELANADGTVATMINSRDEIFDSFHGKDVQLYATFEEADEGEEEPIYRGTIENIEYRNRNVVPSVLEITKSLLTGKLPHRQTWDGQYIPIAYATGSGEFWDKVKLKPILCTCTVTEDIDATETLWDVNDASLMPDPAMFGDLSGKVTIRCSGEYLYYTARDLVNNQLTVVRKDPTEDILITSGPGEPDGHSIGSVVELVGAYLVAENAEYGDGAAWYSHVHFREDDEAEPKFGEWVDIGEGHTRYQSLAVPTDADTPEYSVYYINDAPIKIKFGATDAEGFVRRFPDLYLDLGTATGTKYNPCDVIHDLLTNTDYGAGLSLEHFPDEWWEALDGPGEISTWSYLSDMRVRTLIGYDGQIDLMELVSKFCMEMFARFFFTAEGVARLKVIRPPRGPYDVFLYENQEALGEIEVTKDFTKVVPKVVIRTGRDYGEGDGDRYTWTATEEVTDTSYYPRIKNKEPMRIDALFIEDDNGTQAAWLAQKYIYRYGYPDILFNVPSSLWTLGHELFEVLQLTTGTDKQVASTLCAITGLDLAGLLEGKVGMEAASYESWLGGHWGYWTNDAADIWADASDAEKEINGYWSQNNGKVINADPDSFMWSRWF